MPPLPGIDSRPWPADPGRGIIRRSCRASRAHPRDRVPSTMPDPTQTPVPGPAPDLTRTADSASANLSGQTLTPGGPGETSPPATGPVAVPPGVEVIGELGRGG